MIRFRYIFTFGSIVTDHGLFKCVRKHYSFCQVNAHKNIGKVVNDIVNTDIFLFVAWNIIFHL